MDSADHFARGDSGADDAAGSREQVAERRSATRCQAELDCPARRSVDRCDRCDRCDRRACRRGRAPAGAEMRPRRSRVVSPGTQSTASSPGVVRTVTAASRFDTGGMTTRCEDHASDTRSPQRLSGTAAETSLVICARSSIAVSLEPTTAWNSSDVADSVRSSEPTAGIQTSSWSPPSATDSKRRKRCRTSSSQSEESWGRIMSVIAIMLSVLQSHVEKKLTAVDHLPKSVG